MKICPKKPKQFNLTDSILLKITIIWLCIGWQGGIYAQDLQVSMTGKAEPAIFIETLDAENKVTISDESGYVLQQVDYDFPSSKDPSFLVYGSPFGSIIRENIANFLWINRQGQIIHSESNSSGSEDGEAVSELATDPQFRTQVVYNPKIVFGNSMGSSAQIITSDKQSVSLHYSTSRQLRRVFVSNNGAFVALVTAQDGRDDVVKVFDRYGNSIAEWEFSQPVEGVEFSEDGRYHTLFSGGRVGVYDSHNSQRIGSSSIRGNSILTAAYLPSKSTIAVVTADVIGTRVHDSGVGVHVYPRVTEVELNSINVADRRISKQTIAISVTEQLSPIYFTHKDNRLLMKGLATEFTVN
jgi:hypothetical protein